MGELARMNGLGSELQAIDVGSALEEAIYGDFSQRGRLTGGLVIATLTESGYAEAEGKNQFGYVMDEEAGEPERHAAALAILREGREVKIPGAKALRLESYKTHYGRMLRDLRPGRRDPKLARKAYEEGFEERMEAEEGFGVRGLTHAVKIIKNAPSHLRGVRLDDVSGYGGANYRMLTDDGRVITLEGKKRYSPDYDSYWLPKGPSDLRWRRGRIPRNHDLEALEQRIVADRTGHNRRG